jgi:hypothetical protein
MMRSSNPVTKTAHRAVRLVMIELTMRRLLSLDVASICYALFVFRRATPMISNFAKALTTNVTRKRMSPISINALK